MKINSLSVFRAFHVVTSKILLEIEKLFTLFFPSNVFWTHFREVRWLMTVHHWSLFRACSTCKFRLASSSCIFFLQVFLGLPDGRYPSTSISWVFPKIYTSSLITTCQNHPSLLPLSPAPNSLTPHLPATSKLLTRSLQVTPAIYLSIFLSQPSNILVSLPSNAHVSHP